MRRLIRKQDLTQTFLDIVKKNDKEVLEICYEVAQYRMNQHFEKAKEVKMKLDAYTGWTLSKVNEGLTVLATILFLCLPEHLRVQFRGFLVLWLLIYMIHTYVSYKQYRQSLSYICVDELFSRKLIRAEKDSK